MPKRGDVDKLLRRAAKGLSTAKSRPAKSKPKSKPPAWKSLPDDQLAAYLLGHPTLPDSSWSDRAGRHSRRKGEGREAFIRRVLLGEEAAA